jgi:hypothetical protein
MYSKFPLALRIKQFCKANILLFWHEREDLDFITNLIMTIKTPDDPDSEARRQKIPGRIRSSPDQ